MKKLKRKSLKSLKKEADKTFSIFIRNRDADQNGTVSCCTCGKLLFWKDSDCGHYISRTFLGTRYEEMNCAAQCKGCNSFKGGAKDEHALYILDTYGPNALDILNGFKLRQIKPTRQWYEEIITKYKGG